jgi:hypothetical protein
MVADAGLGKNHFVRLLGEVVQAKVTVKPKHHQKIDSTCTATFFNSRSCQRNDSFSSRYGPFPGMTIQVNPRQWDEMLC